MEKIPIARALTKRVRAVQDEKPQDIGPSRTISARKYDRPINRAQISLPIQLISTTNVLALNAPDIHPSEPVSPSSASTASTKSYEDSDASPASSSASSISTPDLSRESSPVAVEPNHLSQFFAPSKSKPANPTKPSVDNSKSNAQYNSDAPSVPARATSHTKKTHQTLARNRSRSRTSDSSDKSATVRVRTSLDIMSNKIDEEHPFGAELAQVKEVAEDFGVQDVRIWGEEEQFLADHGLLRFTADDYITEIKPLFGGPFCDTPFSNASWL